MSSPKPIPSTIVRELVQPKTELGNDASDNRDIRDYLDKLHLHDAGLQEGATALAERFRPRTLDELLASPPSEWTVKNLIPERGVGTLVSPSGLGKTFLALELAACLARGQPFMGNKVKKPVGVVYVSGEGRLRERLQALLKRHPMTLDERNRLRVVESPVNLLEGDKPETTLRALIDQVNVVGASIRTDNLVVILDTLARMTPGSDEGAKDMGLAVAACDILRDELSAFVLLLHHTGYTEKGRGRGHSSLFAALDVELVIQAPTAEGPTPMETVRTVTAQKVKDGPERVLGGFTLEGHELGQDEDGDAITSCTVGLLTTDEVPAAKPRGKALTPNGKTLLKCFHQEVDELKRKYGERAPAARPEQRRLGAKDGQIVARVEDVTVRFREALTVNAEKAEKEVKPRTLDSYVTKAWQDVFNKGVLAKDGTSCWLEALQI